MVNFKYYLVLLIGIFLALGLGILIGFSLEEGGVLKEQQLQLAKEVERRFFELQKETQQLKNALGRLEEERKQAESLNNFLFSELVRNRLCGLKVSIIKTHSGYGYSQLDDLLKLAGATVNFSAVVELDKIIDNNEMIEMVCEAANMYEGGRNDIYRSVAEELVLSIYRGGFTPLIERLEHFNLMCGFTDLDSDCDVIILAGSGNEQSEDSDRVFFDIQLIQTALKVGIPVIAVESAEVKNSAIAEYKKLGVSTVDNVNTVYGKLALVSLLDGSEGNFGVGREAQGLLPDPLFLHKAGKKRD